MTRPSGGPVVVVVQARTGSSRFPRKVLADLNGRPIVEHVLRGAAAPSVDRVVLATTVLPGDDELAALAEGLDVGVVRGDVDDVLSRYVDAAELTGAGGIVRVTADCPFVQPWIIDAAVALWRDSGADHVSAGTSGGFPRGLDVEVVSPDALVEAQAGDREEHEHVTLHVYRRPGRFRLARVDAPGWLAHPEWRLCVDEPADLELLRELCRRLGPPEGELPALRDVAELLASDEGLRAINSDVVQTPVDTRPVDG